MSGGDTLELYSCWQLSTKANDSGESNHWTEPKFRFCAPLECVVSEQNVPRSLSGLILYHVHTFTRRVMLTEHPTEITAVTCWGSRGGCGLQTRNAGVLTRGAEDGVPLGIILDSRKAVFLTYRWRICSLNTQVSRSLNDYSEKVWLSVPASENKRVWRVVIIEFM